MNGMFKYVVVITAVVVAVVVVGGVVVVGAIVVVVTGSGAGVAGGGGGGGGDGGGGDGAGGGGAGALGVWTMLGATEGAGAAPAGDDTAGVDGRVAGELSMLVNAYAAPPMAINGTKATSPRVRNGRRYHGGRTSSTGLSAGTNCTGGRAAVSKTYGLPV